MSGSWFAVVPEGWESSVEALAKAQDDIDNQRAANLAKTLAHKPAGPLAFVHANLFDSATASVHPNTSIVISGNKISAVGEDSKVNLPQGAEVVDASGKMLMPGLWDMHVHLQPNDGLLNLGRGLPRSEIWPMTRIACSKCEVDLNKAARSGRGC